MRKLNPRDVADDFDAEVTRLVDYYSRSVSALSGSATEKADTSLLAEHVFLAAAIAFEGAISDVYFAYTNIDSSAFITKKESLIKESIRKEHGEWYASKIELGTIKHIKAADLYPLLDPYGHNITFYDGKKMVAKAERNLVPAHAAKFKSLNASQLKLMNAAKFIRNCIAHRSNSSYEAMTDALLKLMSTSYKGLGRQRGKRVNSVGAYLKVAAGPKSELSRLELYLTELRGIVIALGH